jgi:NADH-quinone oxidoreductase subunit M
MPWLTLLIVLPVAGAVVAWLAGDRWARQVGLIASLATFVVAAAMGLAYETSSTAFLQFTERHDWIPAFGASYSVGVDGIALVLILMSTMLVPITLLAGWHEMEGGVATIKGYVVLTLVLESMMVGVFAATDVFLFYVFFEAILIPMYFLIGRYGGPKRQYASIKFLLYSLLGGLLMLASLIGLWVQARQQLGHGTFDWATLSTLKFDGTTEKWLFAGFFVAFAIKAPLVPVHTWLPDAAAEATPGSATLMVGVLDKIGTFGMLRYLLVLFPAASLWATPAVIVISLISIIYGALLAIGQSDIKRLIAYTSVSHFGFITLGIFAFTSQSQSGATLYMVNHGFSTAALFLVAGFLISRRGSRFIEDFGGVNKVAPIMAGTFLLAGLSSLALPGMSSFVSEFLVLTGTFTRYPSEAIIATTGIILAALYILLMYQRTMTGMPGDEVKARVTEMNKREMVAIAPVVAVIIALGFVPQTLLNIINPTVDKTMRVVAVADPKPAIEGTNS